MGVREERGTGTRFGEQRSNQASQSPISVTEQQTISRFPGEERVQRLIASGPPVQLCERSRRDRDLAAQPARRLHGTPYLALCRVPGIEQRVHRFGVEYQSHQPTWRSPGSSVIPPSRRMYRAISASSSGVSRLPRSSARRSRRSARACCRLRRVNSVRKAEFTSAESVVLPSASTAATRSASRVIETFRLADEVIPSSYHSRLIVRDGFGHPSITSQRG